MYNFLEKRQMKRLQKKFIPCKENKYCSLILRKDFLLGLLISLFFLKALTLMIALEFPKNLFFAEIISSSLLEMINEERIKQGIPPLKRNPLLEKAAMLKAKDILEYDYFSHQSPSGITPWHWFKVAGYQYRRAGENLAIGFLKTEDVFYAWKNSPTHYQNIIDPRFEDVGLVVLKGDFGGNEVAVVVQLFGTPLKPSTSIISQVQAQEAQVQETLPSQSLSSLPQENGKTTEEANKTETIEEKSVFKSLSEDLSILKTNIVTEQKLAQTEEVIEKPSEELEEVFPEEPSEETKPSPEIKEENLVFPEEVKSLSLAREEETTQKNFFKEFKEFLILNYDEIVNRFILGVIISLIIFMGFNFLTAWQHGFFYKNLLLKIVILISFIFFNYLLDLSFILVLTRQNLQI